MLSRHAYKEKVYIVIPAYNAEYTISDVVRELKALSLEVIVVDDGSTDRTTEKALEETPHVLKHVINRGQGAALVTGTTFALSQGAETIVHFDADKQHSPADAIRLIDQITSGEVDIVIGSRILGRAPYKKWQRIKFLGSKIVDRFFSGVSLTDVHNGLRAMNRRAAKSVRITQDRMAHATEIVSEIRRLKLRFEEIQVTINYSDDSSQRSTNRNFFRSSLQIVKDLLVAKIVN